MSAVTLIVAEKPSMARDIARVVGAKTKRDGYLEGDGVWVSWCIGHLAELCEPHEYDPKWKSWSPELLPILPESFSLRPSSSGRAHLRTLHGLMRTPRVTALVNGCDAGREGELIFRYVYQLGRVSKPVKRLWISSLTPAAIRAGLAALRPSGDFDPLADAARSRAEADWLVGINATRALTGLARRGGARGLLMSVGRVQTPTLAMIVRREEAIEAFVSEPYWEVVGTFMAAATNALGTLGPHDTAGPGLYQGLWHRPPRPDEPRPRGGGQHPSAGNDDSKPKPTRLASRAEAEAIVADARGQPGRIERVEHKTVRERPPLLFDLTNLQKDANRRFRMSAKRTLAAAQNLYERHKAITYPRTDARHLTADISAELPGVLDALPPPYQELAARAQARGVPRQNPGRMFDDSKVGDHHAIIPTTHAARTERLGDDERRVYDLIVRRFLAGFLPDAVFEKTRIETRVAGHLFVTNGRVRVEEGWHAAEPPPSRRRGKHTDDEPDLPALTQGAAVDTETCELREGHTQPPKRYTEATLLGAMEHAGRGVDDAALEKVLEEAGLGTPATRAAIIETLLARDYIRRDGGALHPTANGRALIAAIPVEELLSPELTGVWEQRLADIARGRGQRAVFMGEIRAFTRRIVDAVATQAPPAASAPAAEVLGRCPVCGTEVTQGFKTYRCATGRSCSFVIFDRIAGRKTSPALVKVLLGRGRSQVLRGFRSKRGKRFSAALVLDPDGRVRFDFGDSNGDSGRSGDDRSGNDHSVDRGLSSSRTSTPRKRRASKQGSARVRAGGAAKTAPEAGPKPPRCPACKRGHIIAGRQAWGCSRWREACRFVVSFVHGDLRIPDDEAERLFRRGQTRLMTGLSSQGRARLVLDLDRQGNVRVELGKRRSPPS
ncbi:DNA topoisomerase 3 [Haliangium sp.]|uniref:type IA DNA topoisomerase n=1 Tax=Haliangium sp. TaxID=2663208 RepID=UPI003D0B3799